VSQFKKTANQISYYPQEIFLKAKQKIAILDQVIFDWNRSSVENYHSLLYLFGIIRKATISISLIQ
jgi:hypothetical protein